MMRYVYTISHISFKVSGAPLKTILHFAQLMINGGQFLKFDYGGDKNIEMYGTENPPEYDLSLVNVPTMMYTGC